MCEKLTFLFWIYFIEFHLIFSITIKMANTITINILMLIVNNKYTIKIYNIILYYVGMFYYFSIR